MFKFLIRFLKTRIIDLYRFRVIRMQLQLKISLEYLESGKKKDQ